LLAVQQLPQYDPSQPSIGQLDALKWMLLSPDAEDQMVACGQFRRLLAMENLPPIDRVIELGLVPRLVELCQVRENHRLQFEAGWALTNVASGTTEQTHVVVEYGGVKTFVDQLASPNEDVREQAIWGLGNIAGDSPALRDRVLAAGALQPIVDLHDATPSLTFRRNAVWTLSNFCRGKPQPPLEQVSGAMRMLVGALGSDDEQIITDAAWALSYIADGPNDRIQAVLDAGILPRIVELLEHGSPSVQTPALRTVGNIVTGDDSQTQRVLACDVLPLLRMLLSHPKRGIRKECVWCISNITAGTMLQIQEVLNADLIPPLVDILRTGGIHEIKQEVVWVIANATSGGSFEQIERLVAEGCSPGLVEVARSDNHKMAKVALNAIKHILEAGRKQQKAKGLSENPLKGPLLEAGVEDMLEEKTQAYELLDMNEKDRQRPRQIQELLGAAEPEGQEEDGEAADAPEDAAVPPEDPPAE